MQDQAPKPAHVIMAENLADVCAGTAPRDQILEEIARSEGSKLGGLPELRPPENSPEVHDDEGGRDLSGLRRIEPGGPE